MLVIKRITGAFLVSVLLCQSGRAKEKVVVFHAGSLAVPFATMEKMFEDKNPQYDIVREAAGSRACARKIIMGKRADVMASADYSVIDTLLIPEFTKFNARFARNEMVLAYTAKSRFASEITAENWPQILLRKGVKTGHSNPNLDPCGYRAVLVIQLAGAYYGIQGFYETLLGYGASYNNGEEDRSKIMVRPKESDLTALLEIGAIDYFPVYRSIAVQHSLKFIELPREINLGRPELKDLYRKASFLVSGKKQGTQIKKYGEPIVYAITLVRGDKQKDASPGATAFVKFVLSDEGQRIMDACGQPPLQPPVITGDFSAYSKNGGTHAEN